jgi:hypothetical protein
MEGGWGGRGEGREPLSAATVLGTQRVGRLRALSVCLQPHKIERGCVVLPS